MTEAGPLTEPGRLPVDYTWRGEFTDLELNTLHAEGFGHVIPDGDWWGMVNRPGRTTP